MTVEIVGDAPHGEGRVSPAVKWLEEEFENIWQEWGMIILGHNRTQFIVPELARGRMMEIREQDGKLG